VSRADGLGFGLGLGLGLRLRLAGRRVEVTVWRLIGVRGATPGWGKVTVVG